MTQRSDIELIEGAIARNHKAFENLVTRYYRSIDSLMPDVPYWEHTTTVKGQTKQRLSQNNDSVVFHMNFTFVTNAISCLCHLPSDYIEIQIVDNLSPVVFRSSSPFDDISVVMPRIMK